MNLTEKYLTEAKDSKDWIIDSLNAAKEHIDIAINGVKKISLQSREKADVNHLLGAKHQVKLAKQELDRSTRQISKL